MFEYFKLIYFLLRSKTIFIRRFSNGMGDNLLLTGLLPILRRKYPNYKLVVETDRWKDIFINNPNIDWVTSKHIKTTKRHIRPKYRILPDTQKSIYLQMANYIGSKLPIRPEFFLTTEEKNKFISKLPPKYIVFCPEGKQSFVANRKEWGKDNFQYVINVLKSQINFVQIGIKNVSLLEGVTDFRGLNIRESASIIYNSLFFWGLEGGLMHLAKSVNKKSVIIYGGIITPEISGYKDNINLYYQTSCSPCFNSEKKLEICSHMSCMKAIKKEYVVKVLEKVLEGTK